MSTPIRPAARRSRRRRGYETRSAVRLAALLLAFLVGLAIGSALDDNPETGDTRTYVRTLEPRALAPRPAPSTVTITVTTG